MNAENRKANALIHESSPYLLQHAYNPVQWYPWNETTLQLARDQDKMLLISVGYSACHWCHVMERESFEDEEVAALMNEHFICIKVDREERPDIDQVYMTAVQLMTGQGGWPLNCVALPDGRPVYGGTYFRKDQWMNVLHHLSDLFNSDRNKMVEYAVRLSEGIQAGEQLAPTAEQTEFTSSFLRECVEDWSRRFDRSEGGANRSPKFPLPNNYLFLLRYGFLQKDEACLEHVHLTLKKMAMGGIYDQLGGGFERYSVDSIWKVPHFEKMLYDNAQLISLYAEAYQQQPDPLYKKVVYQTIEWVLRELCSDEQLFYSALDADSEGVEGKFYTWTKEELHSLLGDNFPLFADYYSVNDSGYWEEERYILLRMDSEEELAKRWNISLNELQDRIRRMEELLLKERNKRLRPGLDDKTLCSWNAMMIKALADAASVFGENLFLEKAEAGMTILLNKQLRKDGGLNHAYKNGKSSINGYLEDYAFVAEALWRLYEVTCKESYLYQARTLCSYVDEHFYDQRSGMYYFTSDLDPPLIVRKMEVSDNVIPASNSVMAHVLFRLGHYFQEPKLVERAGKMVMCLKDELLAYGAGYSNWAILYQQLMGPFYEMSIVGKSVNEKRQALRNYYLPNMIFAGTAQESSLPLLQQRWVEHSTLIYVCKDQHCLPPEQELTKAVAEIRS